MVLQFLVMSHFEQRKQSVHRSREFPLVSVTFAVVPLLPLEHFIMGVAPLLNKAIQHLQW